MSIAPHGHVAPTVPRDSAAAALLVHRRDDARLPLPKQGNQPNLWRLLLLESPLVTVLTKRKAFEVFELVISIKRCYVGLLQQRSIMR